MILLDVDRFKLYNDTHGHRAGDEVLRRLARVLRTSLDGQSLAARYGGEEFLILLPGADVREAGESAERVRRAIETADWPLRPVTASLGVATLRCDLADPYELIDEADQALYRSKRRGRNRATHALDSDPRNPSPLDTLWMAGASAG